MVGDITGNTDRVLAVCHAQHADGIQMVVFPELTLTRYPPEDLLLRGDVLVRTEALQRLCHELPADLLVIVGYPKAQGDALFNTAGVITDQQVAAGTTNSVCRTIRSSMKNATSTPVRGLAWCLLAACKLV